MKRNFLRCTALAAVCAIAPMLNSCLNEFGGNAAEFSPGISSHRSNIQQIINTGNNRGYITVSEAQSMLTSLQECAEEVDLMAENSRIAGNNSDVYGSSPYMNSTQRATNGMISLFLGNQQRKAAENAEALKQEVMNAASWFQSMKSAGRIR